MNEMVTLVRSNARRAQARAARALRACTQNTQGQPMSSLMSGYYANHLERITITGTDSQY